MNYYNEINPFAARWLRALISKGLIPDGHVDERSIEDVSPADLAGYVQCHWFAGIGGWALALQLAGIPADWPLWTGSCPCQPYSTAGKQRGNTDERNLWPAFFRLIREYHPDIVFGEQVASAAVIGPTGKIKNVQEVQDREAIFRVLCELKGQPRKMQRMHESHGACAQAGKPGGDVSPIQEMEGRQSRTRACECGKTSGEGERNDVQFRRRRYSTPNRQRGVRALWDTLCLVGAQSMECTIFGPDQFLVGVHEREHEGSLVCSQCDGEYMGAEQDFRDCVGDFKKENESVERLVSQIGGETQECPPVWLDGIQNDLEEIGYTFGASVMAASSVGAPHIRQRLYWGGASDGFRSGGPRLESGSDTRGPRQRDWNGKADLFNALAVGTLDPFAGTDHWPKPLLRGMDDGVSSRVALLHGFGNAIVPQVAAAFVQAFCESVR